MMRSAKCPRGLPNLSSVRQEKVTLGNALAEVAVKLAKAQSIVGSLWCWEQPWTSLMWLFPPVAEFMSTYSVANAYVDVCWFGAPWKKADGTGCNFPGYYALEQNMRVH